MKDYLKISYDSNPKGNTIKEAEHTNLYDDCFKETAKLWKYYDSKIYLIESNDLGRIFFKKGKPAYYEIFEDKRTDIIGISKKISFLYIPSLKDNKLYDKDNCIGSRYYEKNKLIYFMMKNWIVIQS